MLSRTKKVLRSAAVAFAAAATITLTIPSGNAFAIDHVACKGGENFLKIWSHNGGTSRVDCYANRGKTNFGGRWVDKISTGNNSMIYYDHNGDSVKYGKWKVITFRHAVHVDAIEIV